MTSPGFLLLGSINYDLTYRVARPPHAHEKIRALEQWAGPGGSASNTAYLLGRAGEPVMMAGCVGEDVLGAECLSSLESVGVDVSCVQKTANAPTGLCTIIVTPTDKRMVSSVGANRWLRLDEIGRSRPDHRIGHIHVSSGGAETLNWAFATADDAEATLSLEWNGRDHRRYERAAALNFMNADELRRLEPGTTNLEDFSRRLATDLAAWVVVTDGARGAWATNGDEFERCSPPRKVTLIDRTGGGDAFDAGFLQAWKSGQSIMTCLGKGLGLACELLELRGTRPS